MSASLKHVDKQTQKLTHVCMFTLHGDVSEN